MKKVVHFECGLGNQMVCYANYLLAKKYNPEDTIYLEGLVYRIGKQSIGINQWNGLEIKKIFGIEIPDIFDQIEYKKKVLDSMQSRYLYNDGQNNSESAWYALKDAGIVLDTDYVLANIDTPKSFSNRVAIFASKPSKSIFDLGVRKFIYWISRKKFQLLNTDTQKVYSRPGVDFFYPLSFDIMKDLRRVNEIKDELYRDFTFPEIVDDANLDIYHKAISTNSISIHARRSDFLQYNNDCYKFGYFKKSVKYMRDRVENPVFFIFSEDSEWCRNNLSTLGLDASKDTIYFIDWNSGENSYRDMQLMSCCKHNIITKSSFGWWAAFLNRNPNKLLCSQFSEYYSQKYF